MPVIDRRLVVNDRGDAAGGTSLLAAIRELRKSRYDVAIDLQGLIKSAVIARSSGAPRVIGFHGALSARAAGAAVLHRACTIRAAAASTPPTRRGTSCRSTWACSSRSASSRRAPEFPIEDRRCDASVRGAMRRAHRRRVRAAQSRARPGPTSAGRRSGSAQWPPRCASGTGCASVVLWGPGERDLAERVVGGVRRRGGARAADDDRRCRGAGARRRRHGFRATPDRRTSPRPSARRSSASTARRGRNATARGCRRTSPCRGRPSVSAIICADAGCDRMCLLDIEAAEVH